MKFCHVQRFILLSVFTIGIFYLMFLHHTIIQNRLINYPVLSKNNNKSELVKRSSTPIVMPIGYQPVSSVIKQTTYIGTVDHPTVEGGVLNSVDNIAISHEVPTDNAVKNSSPLPNATVIDKPFTDAWATNDKIKKILISAAQQGKLNYVLKKSAEMKLPATVALVPLVESQYQSKAVSPKGAVGDWQLMPSSAKDYGIAEQDGFQFVASTDAALKMLSRLHSQFGSWDLAFAAYNAGSKRVQEALQKNPHAKDVNELQIPEETKTYVNRIKAVSSTLEGVSFHGA